MPSTLPSTYDPSTVESRIYQMWEDGGFFEAKSNRDADAYAIIMPPPNVTGQLHLGHGLEDALTDALVRWRRMRGFEALWLPGEDHAGIATQNVIERELANEGLSRHDIGRESFLERTWEWVKQYRGRIYEQHRALGASADWSRDVFTLDPKIVRAVRTTFVNLYNDGLIYRGLRMINWCPRCETALSDLEVDYVEEEASLYHVRYPIVGEGGMPLPDALVIATVRPETMLGDTGVAVHPEDPRFEEKIGKTVLLPIVGREIPIVADDAVKLDFGTGALKVTPAHDPVDWEIGQRHDLEAIVVIDREAKISDDGGPYVGLDRFEAREAIVRDLEEQGFLQSVVPYTHTVGQCSRCKNPVEPLPSEQWWVGVNREYKPGQTLASYGSAAISEGRVNIVPERFGRIFLNWLDEIRDWCISRQLWWGHQIPVWYCECGEMTVAVEDPEICQFCDSTKLTQDEDVLDTWFSSALAPHADLGWPDDTEDLKYFYPTTDMQMGYDIMFFWCARMLMFGLYNMGSERATERDIPFKNILFHGLIRDAKGEKMTKSRGNVIDPLISASTYGADAFRFALLTGSTLGQDMKYNEERLVSSRNFANKLWNSARFILMNLQDEKVAEPNIQNRLDFPLEDRWILSRLSGLEDEVHSLLSAYQIGEAGRRIHDFLYTEFCDWYLEISKVRLRSNDKATVSILLYVLKRSLALLHPFMPFVTEELWGYLVPHVIDTDNSNALITPLIVEAYPVSNEVWLDSSAEASMLHVIEVNRVIRNIRMEKGLPAGTRPHVFVRSDIFKDDLLATSEATCFTSHVELTVLSSNDELPSGDFAFARVTSTEVALALPEVDVSAERERLNTELFEAEAYLKKLEGQLENKKFLEKAPENVVMSMRTRFKDAEERAQGLRERLDLLD